MEIHLSAKSESIVPYESFGPGYVTSLIPQLVNLRYNPAGVAFIVYRRKYSPKVVREEYNRIFWTGDSVSRDETGSLILTLDDLLLRELTPKSQLLGGALKLEPSQ